MRSKIVAGNWKMNLNWEEGMSLIQKVVSNIELNDTTKVVFAPPAPYLNALAGLIPNSKWDSIWIAGQNCHQNDTGAYTGDFSAAMLKDVGCDAVILGHSERRKYYKESNEVLKTKTDKALANGLRVIFCCGEQLSERESKKHFDVVENQIKEALFHLPPKQLKHVIIAYEPVWAIGTGVTASPAQAEEMHKFIRDLVAKNFTKGVANTMSILYGGSVKPANAKEIFAQPMLMVV